MAAIRVGGGRVPFQSGNPEVDLGRSATQPANRAPARELSPQGGVQGSGAVLVTGGLGQWQSRGVTAEGVAFIGSRRQLSTWLGSPSSSISAARA
jgi:hypothetical protein